MSLTKEVRFVLLSLYLKGCDVYTLKALLERLETLGEGQQHQDAL